MSRALAAFLSLALPGASFASGGHAGHGHVGGTSQTEIDGFLQKNPEIAKKQRRIEDSMKRRQQTEGAYGDERPDDAPLDPEIQARIRAQALAAASDESFMADIIAEAEEEKAQVVEENIWAAAEAKATPETRALYREYLRRVYFFGSGSSPSVARHVAYIKASLEKPNAWGAFPTLKLGPLPPGIAGLWSGGDITLISLSIVVLSHEWHHHFDGAIEGGIDGQNEFPHQAEPEERYAYAHMGSEI